MINIDSFPVPLKVIILTGLFWFSSFLSASAPQLVLFAVTGTAGSAEGADILFSAILI